MLYALGGASAGLTCFMEDGHLCYEYNLLIYERYKVRSEKKVSAGDHNIRIETTLARPGAPLTVKMFVDDDLFAEMTTNIRSGGVHRQ